MLISTLLDKEDRAIRIAAGEALALIFEMGALEKFSAEAKASSDSISKELVHIQGLKSKILNQVRNLSTEAVLEKAPIRRISTIKGAHFVTFASLLSMGIFLKHQ